MKDCNIQPYLQYFKDYVKRWYHNSNELINKNIKLKEEHTYRVWRNIIELSNLLALPQDLSFLGQIIGIFHDIARFKQFYNYQTFDDRKSFDHAEEAVKILQESAILKDLSVTEQNHVLAAIKLHNKKSLPSFQNSTTELLAKLIRDADKLDIWYIISVELSQEDNPSISLGYSGDNNYNPRIVELLLKGQLVDYSLVRSTIDFKLTALAWIYDINFPETFKLVKERKLLEPIIDTINIPEINSIKKVIYNYILR